MSLFTPVAILVLVIFFLSTALRILKEYERGVIFRLRRVINAKGPEVNLKSTNVQWLF